MFNKWFNRFKIPSLEWIQIEVTSYCNAKCIYCPQTVFQDAWQNRHFPMHSFERLVPVFEKKNQAFNSSEKYQRMGFGNIDDDPISDIWHQKSYAKSRKSFYYYNPPAPCKTFPNLFIG